MSDLYSPGPLPVAGQPDDTVVMPSAGVAGFLFGFVHLAIGGVAVALSVDEGFAEGKVVFAADAWRFLLGAVGGLMGLLAVRGFVRMAGGQRPVLSKEVRRRAARRGLVLVLVGAWFLATAVVEPLADETIRFGSWTRTLFGFGGAYLVLLGLSFRLDPTGPLRRERLRQGYGAAGTATILRASDTGTTVNDAPQVQIDFSIECEGRTFTGSDRIVMERAKLALLVPGSTLDVLVDRGDPRVFHVDWNSWRAPAPEHRT